MDWQTIETETIALIRRIAPELNGTPLYIVAIEDTDFPAGSRDGSMAATSSVLDLLVRPFVRWEGRGLCLLYSRERIANGSLFAVTLHEAAHWIDLDFVSRLAESAPFVETHAAAFFSIAATEFTRIAPTTEYTLSTHPLSFLRIALHLRWRAAWAADCPLSISEVVGYDGVDLGVWPSDLNAALLAANEFERFVGMRLADIATQPLPKQFQKICIEDRQRFEAIICHTVAETYEELPMGIFERIKQAFTKRQRDDQLSFAELVRRVADSEAVDATEAANTLRIARRTPDDLAAAVERLQQRREVRRWESLEQERLAEHGRLMEIVTAAREEYDAVVEAARIKRDAIVEPALRELPRDLQGVKNTVMHARQRLREMAAQNDDADLLAIN